MSEPRFACIITAAGRGTRAGGGDPKQWRSIGGQPVLSRAVAALRPFGHVTVVLHPDDMARGRTLLGDAVTLVEGGETRSASVRAALEALPPGHASHVLIHDGARPLVPRAVIDGVVAALRHGADAAAPGLPVTDALWRTQGGTVTGTADREGLVRAQTPQGFRLDAILAAHRAHPEGAADDVELALRNGIAVVVTEGAEQNIKLTWPGDFARAEAMLEERRMDLRVGQGFDVHAFEDGTSVTLCGVAVPHTRGLAGHSDADVGMHALTDAILGALAEGDIGRHFPPSDPQWKAADSAIFLARAGEIAAERGYRLGNADVTLICELPKIGPHARAMQQRLAEILGCEPGRISVKATTSERLGFTGREEGIAALASATLVGA